jgi:uncharacterized Zn-finger protein
VYPCGVCLPNAPRLYFNSLTMGEPINLAMQMAKLSRYTNSSHAQPQPDKTSTVKQQIGRRAYPCKFCEKSFRWASSLNVHLVSHTNRGLRCSVCGKAFYQKSDLERHMMTHAVKCSCSVCGKMFKNFLILRAHLLQEHGSVMDEDRASELQGRK